MTKMINYYKSPLGLSVYQFTDDSNVTITGNVSAKHTIKEFDSAYDFEEYIQKKIDCKGIGFDSESCQFFAYTKTPERAVDWVKSVEKWFEHVREVVG